MEAAKNPLLPLLQTSAPPLISMAAKCDDCGPVSSAQNEQGTSQAVEKNAAASNPASSSLVAMPVSAPRIVITYCTQCRWMLRAAYFAQELLSTFGTSLGEIALRPATGGLFTVELAMQTSSVPDSVVGNFHGPQLTTVLLWDRKTEGGFPETKVLKQRVRDHIDPLRDLGHSDRPGKAKGPQDSSA